MTTQQRSVTVFERSVSAATAENTMLESDDDMVTADARRILCYPYRLFTFDLHAEALLNELDDRVHCAIDLCNGDELFIDDVPEMSRRYIESDAIVSVGDEPEDPETTARRYLLEVARKHLRVGSAPDLTLVDARRVHRPFHLVECETVDGTFLTYIVDGLVGDFHRVYR